MNWLDQFAFSDAPPLPPQLNPSPPRDRPDAGIDSREPKVRSRSPGSSGGQLESALCPVDPRWFEEIGSRRLVDVPPVAHSPTMADVAAVQTQVQAQLVELKRHVDASVLRMTRAHEELRAECADLAMSREAQTPLSVHPVFQSDESSTATPSQGGATAHEVVTLRHALEDLEVSCKAMEEKLYKLAGSNRQSLEALREEIVENFTRAQLEKRLDQFFGRIQHEVRSLESNLQDDIGRCADDLALVADGAVASGDLLTKNIRGMEEIKKKKSEFTAVVLDEFVSVVSTYQVRGNVWDATLLLGADIPMGRTGTVLMVTSVFCNILVQCAICIFVAMLSIAQEGELDPSTRDAAKLWNAQTTEDIVHRVCTQDFTLSTDFRQAHAHELYDTYIQQRSSLLCLAMLLVWTLTIVREMSMVLYFTRAVRAIPVDWTTKLEIHGRKVVLVSVGYTKQVGTHVIALTQLCICLLLLLSGCAWLAATESQDELLLNSVALSYVMEVDELLYSIMVPRKVRAIVEQMSPMTYSDVVIGPKVVRMFLRWMKPCVVLGVVLAIYVFRVIPRMDLMQEFLAALCDE
mmetsp:Transcript_36475/g.97084  ORF Transcript_36475/g.97084 Transcript_36475/m.97084 type:complete len:576 (-) Transcript_36475:171-1898(-)